MRRDRVCGSVWVKGGADAPDGAAGGCCGRRGACAVVCRGRGSAGSVQARWVIEDLGTLGGSYSGASAINERGHVVRQRARTGRARTRSCGRTGRCGPRHVRVAVGRQRRCRDQRPRAGHRLELDDQERARTTQCVPVAERENECADLGALGGNSVASAINERGQIVGWSGTDLGLRAGRARPVAERRMPDLGTSWAARRAEASRSTSAARSSAVRDYAVTSATVCKSGTTRSCGQNGKMTDLGTLGGRLTARLSRSTSAARSSGTVAS